MCKKKNSKPLILFNLFFIFSILFFIMGLANNTTREILFIYLNII